MPACRLPLLRQRAGVPGAWRGSHVHQWTANYHAELNGTDGHPLTKPWQCAHTTYFYGCAHARRYDIWWHRNTFLYWSKNCQLEGQPHTSLLQLKNNFFGGISLKNWVVRNNFKPKKRHNYGCMTSSSSFCLVIGRHGCTRRNEENKTGLIVISWALHGSIFSYLQSLPSWSSSLVFEDFTSSLPPSLLLPAASSFYLDQVHFSLNYTHSNKHTLWYIQISHHKWGTPACRYWISDLVH